MRMKSAPKQHAPRRDTFVLVRDFRLSLVLLIAVGCVACTDEDESAPSTAQPACSDGEIMLPDGVCGRAGIAPDGCGVGFAHNGEASCEAILPVEDCPPGQMALMGETSCRPVMPCGEGTWGDIVTDGDTEHVDGSYTGGNSDGSQQAPWTTIGEAISDAAFGATIAVAEGSYVEDVDIRFKTVHLVGVCPERVEIVGSDSAIAAIVVQLPANGTEIQGVAVRGGGSGISLSGVLDVTLDRVWVHDTARRGISAEDTLGPTSLRIIGSLIERAHEVGVRTAGSSTVIESTVVRDTQPSTTTGLKGRGITVQLCGDIEVCELAARSDATLRSVLVERNVQVGVFSSGADITIESSLVRRTASGEDTFGLGRGISLQMPCLADDCLLDAPTNATIRKTVVAENQEVGVAVVASFLDMQSSVIRDTVATAEQALGDGLLVYRLLTAEASATVTSSRVENSARGGITNFGAAITLQSTGVQCAAFELETEQSDGVDAQLSNLGGNACGCPAADGECTAVSTGLSPPAGLP
jgi:hypothetical protein